MPINLILQDGSVLQLNAETNGGMDLVTLQNLGINDKHILIFKRKVFREPVESFTYLRTFLHETLQFINESIITYTVLVFSHPGI